ncbi:hypothetical protein DXT63_08500 [Thermoanaerobacteraceae bacterium SP2]|nr:hypothetical protein DXT63_08500 [Thermoanaerobacteraceae bacterium SP2]
MIYVLDEWIKHKENRDEIYRILEYLEQDLVTEEMQKEKRKLINRLKELGEDKIYDLVTNRQGK